MKLKPAIFLVLIAAASVFFSACTSVESRNSEQEEVVIEDNSRAAGGEIYITNADIKKENLQTSMTQSARQATEQIAKRLLADKSEIETLVDGYGNKIETRYFPGNTRISYVALRTSIDGTREVTVYGANGSAKIVAGIGKDALSLSAEQLANAAQLDTSASSPVLRNYLKNNRKTEPPTPLQPLPSSAFEQPQPAAQPSAEPVETLPPATDDDGEQQPPPESSPEEN